MALDAPLVEGSNSLSRSNHLSVVSSNQELASIPVVAHRRAIDRAMRETQKRLSASQAKLRELDREFEALVEEASSQASEEPPQLSPTDTPFSIRFGEPITSIRYNPDAPTPEAWVRESVLRVFVSNQPDGEERHLGSTTYTSRGRPPQEALDLLEAVRKESELRDKLKAHIDQLTAQRASLPEKREEAIAELARNQLSQTEGGNETLGNLEKISDDTYSFQE